MIGRAGGAAARCEFGDLPGARGGDADAGVGDVGPDLKDVRLGSNVRSGSLTTWTTPRSP
jgi:hypothetical protein